MGSLPVMLVIAAMGMAVAVVYGILHDQVTYTISPEYFTKMKFVQFHYADPGYGDRVFVGAIGILATWWVGLAAGWFLARVVVPAASARRAIRASLRGSGIIFGFAIFAAVVGGGLGALHGADYSYWTPLTQNLGIVDVPAIVTVAIIHNASYLGGLVGLMAAIACLKRTVGSGSEEI